MALEGWTVPRDHVNSLLLKPPVMSQLSGLRWAGKRKVSDASDVSASKVFRRKYLVSEHSVEAHPRISPSGTVANSENGEINVSNKPYGEEIDGDEFEQGQGNYEFQYESGEEVPMKSMGWFPVEEYSNAENDANLSVRWILDEAPSASDLPHLENLLEISPSKFWSPKSETRKRPPVHFGYLSRSESSQSSHSIQYFLNDSPDSSPEVTRTIHVGAHCTKISSNEPNDRCPQACPDIHGMAQKILTPCMDRVSWTPQGSIETTKKSPSLDYGTKLAQVQVRDPEMSPAFSEDNPKEKMCRGKEMASPVHQNHTHHQQTGCVANFTASDSSIRGKNLVTDFLKVSGEETEVKIEALKNDLQHRDNRLPARSTLWTQVENMSLSSGKMRVQCSAGLSTNKRENASLSLEPEILHGGDGHYSTERDSLLLWPLSSPANLHDRLQVDQDCTRNRNDPLVPISDDSYHPNWAARFRDSLHEKLESQLHFPKPGPEFLSDVCLFDVQHPKMAPDDAIAWPTPAVPRVSRKRSSRVTTPKGKRKEVSNVLENGKAAQPVRLTPNKDYFTCKKRMRSPKSTVVELPTFPRNVKLRLLTSSLGSDCEIDQRNLMMPESKSPAKPPTLTTIVKPLRHIKTTPAKGRTRVRVKTTPKGIRKGLPTDSRIVSTLQFVNNSPVNFYPDESKAALRHGKNPVGNGKQAQRHEVEEESSRKLPPDCETSKFVALRSSKYRGVTRHRHTGRYEAHLWDNSKVKLGLAKRGRQVYLGAYPDEDQAAQAHDLAALKYWGLGVYTNFPAIRYAEELETVKNLTKEEYILILRRRSPGFTRGFQNIVELQGITKRDGGRRESGDTQEPSITTWELMIRKKKQPWPMIEQQYVTAEPTL